MRRAVYVAMVLWFARKVLRKLSRGTEDMYRVPARVMPGDPVYNYDLDRPRDLMLVMLASGWQHPVPGSRLSCLTYRQYNSLDIMVHDRFSGRLDRESGEHVFTMLYVFSGRSSVPVDEGEVPPGITGMDGEISRFIRRAAGIG